MSDKVRTEAALLVAEADFLRAHGWVPLAPLVPGGEMLWTDSKSTTCPQASAIIIQRGRNIG